MRLLLLSECVLTQPAVCSEVILYIAASRPQMECYYPIDPVSLLEVSAVFAQLLTTTLSILGPIFFLDIKQRFPSL